MLSKKAFCLNHGLSLLDSILKMDRDTFRNYYVGHAGLRFFLLLLEEVSKLMVFELFQVLPYFSFSMQYIFLFIMTGILLLLSVPVE